MSGNSRQSTPSKVSTASVGITSAGASTNCSSSPSPSFTMMNGISEVSNNGNITKGRFLFKKRMKILKN
uniref:Uncharacterized protein n=1 Tax=Panagrolaimus sp. PS1159 TaxID=55785 RepID=A0AC35FVM2_9BILA